MVPEYETLQVHVTGPVGQLVLDRPQRLNALSPLMLRELVDAATWFDAQPGVTVVMVRGAGRAFCAGFDLTEITDQPDPRAVVDLGREMAEAVDRMRAVTVAAVHGHCVGGGVVLVLACDLRLAASDAVFSVPETALGVPLTWGGIPRLVREVGPAVALDLVLTCRPVPAAEAAGLRLVSRVVQPAGLLREAETMATLVAQRPALVLDQTLRQVSEAAEALVSTYAATADADLALAALSDPEASAVRARYVAARTGPVAR